MYRLTDEERQSYRRYAGLALPRHTSYPIAPAWTTDWMSETGRRKLREYGIAPPGPAAHAAGGPVKLAFSVRCPHCGSPDTREVSHFGSTPCKALWTCRSCAEPFESFKAL